MEEDSEGEVHANHTHQNVRRSKSRDLRRTSSHASATSSRHSSTVQIKHRNYDSSASLQEDLAPSDKSLTSFPSLSPSPENSPHKLESETTTASKVPLLQPPASKPTPVRSIVRSLITRTPSSRSRSSLFDDTPVDVRDVPGVLHHVSDDQICRLLARNGPVILVRRLAEDLAQRDVQITELRRRAEERERTLRKMLHLCEVTDADIEARLRELEGVRESTNGSVNDKQGLKSKKSGPNHPKGTSIAESMTARMLQAMDDEFEFDQQDEQTAPVSFTRNSEDYATIRATKAYKVNSTHSVDDSRVTGGSSLNEMPGQLADRSKPPSNGRQGLDSTTFQRSRQSLRRSLSGAPIAASGTKQMRNRGETSETTTRKPSGSVASWALRLVAGGTQSSNGTSKQQTTRRRATTMDTGKKAREQPGSASVSNARVLNQEAGAGRSFQQPRPSFSSAVKSVISTSPETLRSAASSIMQPASPVEESNQSETNLGPVEMDAILPHESRPPTLLQQNPLNDRSDLLTDRFGFIYDHRRRIRQNDTAAALPNATGNSHAETLGNARQMLSVTMKNGYHTTDPGGGQSFKERPSTPSSVISSDFPDDALPTKKWQDYLKLATFPTELLSHTPFVAPITSVQTSADDAPNTIVIAKRGSVPSQSVNPEPCAARISSHNAEIAQTPSAQPAETTTSGSKETDPVKALLAQATALHDSLQRQKEVRWNDFFRKVRAARHRDGEGPLISEGRRKITTMPEVSLLGGELIGAAEFGNKGRDGRAKWKEFRNLVLGGIPVAYRPKVWVECSGATSLRTPQYYEDLVKNDSDDDPDIVNQIEVDITRTLTDNVFFRRGPGVAKLKEVLLAYSRRNPEVGYCQGMNLIAACLLLIMPTAEDAFWILASLVENILPPNYYDSSLLAAQADQKVLLQYVSEILPKLAAHFEALGVELEALTFQWFLSIFTDCLSAEALFRVWDVVLCLSDGSTFLFQLAVALLKLNEPSLLRYDSPAAVYHYINHEMTNHAISIDGLIRASEALKKVIKPDEVAQRRKKAVKAEKEIARQRAEIRAGKGKARASEDDVVLPSAVLPALASRVRETNGGIAMTIDEFGNEQFGEMEVRTPMPIEEEAQWRA